MFARLCTLTALSLFAVSCGGGDSPTRPPPPTSVATTVTLSPSTLTLASLGASEQLTATVKDQSGVTMTGVPVTWESSDEAIAMVSSTGLVTSVSNGATAVTARSGSASGTVTITVSQVVTSLLVNPATLSFSALGATARLSPGARDSGGAEVVDAVVTWTTTDKSVATADGSGLVTAVANGTAVIEASLDGLTSEASVSVQQVATSLSFATQPEGARAGEPLVTQPIIELHDANGNVVGAPDSPASGRGVSRTTAIDVVEASIESGGGELLGGTTATVVDGRAAFTDLRIDGLVGEKVLRFSAGELAVLSAPFPLDPGNIASVEKVGDDPSGIIAGGTVTVFVRVVDQFTNPVPDEPINWTVLSGGGSVANVTATSDDQGIASGTWTTGAVVGAINGLRAAFDEARSAEFSVTTRQAVAPLSFRNDMVILSPSESAEIMVLDALGGRVPASSLTFDISDYSCCGISSLVQVDASGFARPNGDLAGIRSVAVRIEAAYSGMDVDGLVVAVRHDTDKERVVVSTEHWRLAIPEEWETRASAAVTDWGTAFDVGWEAQAEIMGKTLEGAQNAVQPNNQLLPQSSAMEDPRVCGLSTVPLSFGRDCFLFPGGEFDGHPRWFIVFHEMGHQSSIAQLGRAIFCQVFCTRATFVEGDASVLSMWSSYRMMNSTRLAPATRHSVSANFDLDTTGWRRELREWEASTQVYDEAGGAGHFGAGQWDGIHARLIEEFGWDYLLRYVRAWRNDPIVRSRMNVDTGGTTVESRATFAAAAVSAALRTDLRERFLGWRFPLDEVLYDFLYTYWLNAMSAPWADV